MNTNSFFGRRVFPILFMALITILCIAPVSAIFLSTKERVQLNESLFLKRAVLFAANIDVPEDPVKAEEVFTGRIETVGEDPEHADYFRVLAENGERDGYVLPIRGPGLWGTIEAVVGFEEDKETFTGVEFTEQNETPGLGGRISEEWFKEQFRGKEAPFELVPEGTADDKSEVDAITGATRTSTFVKELLNKAAVRIKEVKR